VKRIEWKDGDTWKEGPALVPITQSVQLRVIADPTGASFPPLQPEWSSNPNLPEMQIPGPDKSVTPQLPPGAGAVERCLAKSSHLAGDSANDPVLLRNKPVVGAPNLSADLHQLGEGDTPFRNRPRLNQSQTTSIWANS